MNAHNENQDLANLDDGHDRLIDVALREVVGNETPTDLSSRILAANLNPAATTVAAPNPAAAPQPRTRRRAFWATLAVAAMLLVGATLLLQPGFQAVHESAKKSGRADRLGSASENARTIVANNRAISSEFSSLPSNESDAKEASADSSTLSHYFFSDEDADDLVMTYSSETYAQDAGAYGGGLSGRTAAPVADGKEWVEMSDTGLGYVPLAESRTEQFARGEADVRTPVGFKVEAGPGTEVQRYLVQTHPQQNIGLRGLINDAQVPTGGYGGGALTPEGTGPGLSGDQYTRIFENPFIKAEGGNAVSTFSIDVDTASYANVRQFLMEMNTLPPPDAVRIEELVNYFDYDYAGPPTDSVDAADSSAAPGSAGGSSTTDTDDAELAPFAAHVEVAGCPWAADHRLVRIGIKGREMDRSKRPQSNLVFLVDVSGSMNEPNKLPLVVYGLQQLTRELGENDRVAIVVYASSEGLALPSTPGSDQATILAALGRLQAGGSTAGGAGIQLAYQIAEDNFIEGGTNRVILCTDGDFNVGVTSTAELERLCEQKAKDTRVFLSVLGFGRGNLNDAMMEAISNRGNGNYHYVDNRTEARRVLVEEMTGTLVTIAKDVKIQVEFNPREVAGYRLIGYENRMLRTEDFNDDTKDAGEIGAGHTVTALYEIVPAGKSVEVPPVDDLKYQQPINDVSATTSTTAADGDAKSDVAGELLTLKMRYKQPEGDTSRKLDWAITDDGKAFGQASTDFQFAAAVAGFGLLLRDSQYKGNLTYAAALELAQAGLGSDEHGYRAEFVEMIRRAKTLRRQ
ncbi:MAG TPA: von Willebrand factor type A domain-containing protein [Lacipirellulaceae bacterium]|nr:von Willebrand factor type A domain-containing protein [Lacipirellulaceae bacterium]